MACGGGHAPQGKGSHLLCCPGTSRRGGEGTRNPGRLAGCDRTQRYQLSRRQPGGGGRAVIWCRTLRVSGPPPRHCPKAPRLAVLRPLHRLLAPNRQQAAFQPARKTSEKVPTDASAFLPASTWSGSPAGSPPARSPEPGRGTAPHPAPTPPLARWRSGGTARQVRARQGAGCAHAPSPRGCPHTFPRPGSGGVRSAPGERLSPAAPRLTCTGVAAAAGIPLAEPPAAG